MNAQDRQDNQPRIMVLKSNQLEVKRKNRVTVLQIIVACAQPLQHGVAQTAIGEFIAMKFDWTRAARVHIAVSSLQRYVDAAIKTFNDAPLDKKEEAERSTMMLDFQPFNIEELFIGGEISGRSMALLSPWLLETTAEAFLPIVVEAPVGEE